MLLTRLKLNYFGRFHNKEIELHPGINVIYGENEAGKSTIHTFLKGMLFGIERMRGRGAASKDDTYTRYLPWDNPGAYNGSMDIKIEGKEYRLQRSFHANDKNFMVTDLATGREVKLKDGLISELLPGYSESTFKNTISIEQLKAQTDTELAAQVRNYITNLSITKSKEVNVAKATASLNDQRKALEASQTPQALRVLQTEIEEGLAREERIDQLALQLREVQSEEQTLKQQKDAFTAAFDEEETRKMEQFPAILEKYNSYLELTKQSTSLETQQKELEIKVSNGQADQYLIESIKEDMIEARRISEELSRQERTIVDLRMEKAALVHEKTRNSFLCILPAVMIAIIIMIMTEFEIIGVLTAAVCLLIGVVFYLFACKDNVNKQEIHEEKEMNLQCRRADLQNSLNVIMQKNYVIRIEDLIAKQEELQKNFYQLEHVKEQIKDIDKRRVELEDNRDILYDVIMKYMQHFMKIEELSEISVHNLQEEIGRRKKESADRLLNGNHQLEACNLRIEKLRWEISSMEGNEEELVKNKDRYDETEQSLKENSIEIEAIKLALSTIQELSTDIHDTFGKQLNDAVSEVISEITGAKYSDLKIDEKLEVKVGWMGDYVWMDRLSAGTIDQIYFALRLAAADLLLGKDEVPLLLDDAFALYDEERLKAVLTKIAQRSQIILFTCHKREKKILEELQIPYHFVDLSCR
ncbi:MAG: AAA family ATPase [Mobilitalea sp.]